MNPPTFYLLGAVLATAFAFPSVAATAPASSSASSYQTTVDGLVVHLGVVSTQMMKKHAEAAPERTMHGGVPSGGDVYHVQVAIFDRASKARITDAEVSARVGSLGLMSTEKALEPMSIAGRVTYGNYFTLAGRGLYRIRVEIRIPGAATRTAAFVYERSPRGL